MKYKTFLACIGLVVSASSWGDNNHINDRLVTDPFEKASMGFSADEIVYVRENNQPASDKSETEQFSRGISTERIGYLGVEAQGRTGDFTYGTTYGGGDIYRTGSEQYADTLLELPDGSTLTYVRGWGYDSNASEKLRIIVFHACLPAFTAGPIVNTNLGAFETTEPGTPGDWSDSINLNGSNIVVDNQSCTYFARTFFGAANSTIRLYKVRAQVNVSTP